MGRTGLATAAAGLVLLAGCSSGGSSAATSTHSSHPSSPGPAAFTACPTSLGRTFGAAAGGRVTTSSDATAGLLTCRLRARSPRSGACSSAIVTINTGPQAFTDFNRWVDESVQNANQPGLAPVLVPGIGTAADWVPGRLTLEAARTDRWVAVFLTCPHGGRPAEQLAESLARGALAAHP